MSVGAVEKHIKSIFTKLELVSEPTEHRRVLAVLEFCSGERKARAQPRPLARRAFDLRSSAHGGYAVDQPAQAAAAALLRPPEFRLSDTPNPLSRPLCGDYGVDFAQGFHTGRPAPIAGA